MLYPQSNESRHTTSLNGLWAFKADPDDSGVDAGWTSGLPDSNEWMPVPSSYNDLTQGVELRDHIGAVWYEREVYVPKEWSNRRIVLRIGSASHHGTIFWNGEKIAEHQGGFLPFEAEVVGREDGGANRCVVRVDNRLSWDTLPPGVIETHGDFPTSGDKPRQEYLHPPTPTQTGGPCVKGAMVAIGS